MIELTDKVIYKCEYCNKVSLSKGAMTLHERACGKNPKNHMMCADCKHCERLVRELVLIEPDPYTGEEGQSER